MTFEIDLGSNGSEGPWISWSDKGTSDGAVPPRSFYLREEGGAKTPFDGFSTGVVLDIDSLRTGWQKSDGRLGIAPEWHWNQSASRMMPQPGEGFKKGLSVRCAVSKSATATWEQAGAHVWNALTGLAPALSQRPSADVLPLVKMTGTSTTKYAVGSSTHPVLEVVKWVPRPDSLKEGFAVDTAEPAPAQAPKAAPAPVAEPEDAPW